jgi:hypothetical protein
MTETQIVQTSDYLKLGTTLTSVFPTAIPPFREGVYMVETSPALWKFAFYTVERNETFYPEPGKRGRKQYAHIPGHWSEPHETIDGAARNVGARNFTKSYRWMGLSYKH